MAKLNICSAAEDDYTESLRWYAEHSVEAANDFDAEFERALEEISQNLALRELRTSGRAAEKHDSQYEARTATQHAQLSVNHDDLGSNIVRFERL